MHYSFVTLVDRKKLRERVIGQAIETLVVSQWLPAFVNRLIAQIVVPLVYDRMPRYVDQALFYVEGLVNSMVGPDLGMVVNPLPQDIVITVNANPSNFKPMLIDSLNRVVNLPLLSESQEAAQILGIISQIEKAADANEDTLNELLDKIELDFMKFTLVVSESHALPSGMTEEQSR
jgi:hypothetical protein